MFIITRYELTELHRRAIGQQMGLGRLATQDECREFLQRDGERTIETLALPLMPAPPVTDRLLDPLEA